VIHYSPTIIKNSLTKTLEATYIIQDPFVCLVLKQPAETKVSYSGVYERQMQGPYAEVVGKSQETICIY
jgi:hypothetical protein